MLGLKDTSLDTENYQIKLLQTCSIEKRLSLFFSVSNAVLELSQQAIRETKKDKMLAIIKYQYSKTLEEEVKNYLTNFTENHLTEKSMSKLDVFAAIIPIIEIFNKLGIKYHIGGSFASSAYGVPRATAGIDLMADISSKDILEIVKSLGNLYYLSEISIRNAISNQTSFNLIHLGSILKIDIFIPKSRAYDKEVMQRALSKKLEIDNNILTFYLKSAEDIILTKLEWYCLGEEVSERQISDILGVLRVQTDNLDFVYLKKWAVELKVDDLLERVIEEARRF
ncbi:MAG: hypothetical protein WAQ98_04910 [Blastocatellia bacterium]